MRRRLADRAVAGLFVAGLVLPLTLTLQGKEQTLAEFRTPAPPPVWQVSAHFPTQFEAWFRDHFGLRNELVHLHSCLRYYGLHVSPTPDVVCGTDGWLYFAGDGSMTDFQGLRPLSLSDLEQWRRILERRRDRLAQRGIAYLFVVAPNKQSVYPEYLPDGFNHPGYSRLDQLLTYLEQHSDLPLLDLRPILRKAARVEPVYYKLDTHWNDVGAQVAYQAILERLAQQRSGLQARPRSDFVTVVSPHHGDLDRLLALPKTQSEETPCLLEGSGRRAVLTSSDRRSSSPRRLNARAPVTANCPDAPLARLLFLHDSFGEALVPFLAEHFQHTVCLWQPTLPLDLVDQQPPDVVLQEMCERFLSNRPPLDPSEESEK